MKRLLIFLVFGMICPWLVAGATTSEILLSVSSEITPPQSIPGNDGYIKVTVSNGGTAELPYVYVKLESLDTPMQVSDEDFSARYLGGLKAGGSITTLYKFKVPPNTSSGTYAARFTVHKYSVDSIEKMIVEHVLIEVQAPTSLKIKAVDPASFRPGEKTVMTFTLENTGSSSINDVMLSWQMSGDTILPFGSDNKIAISSLEAGQEITFPVNIAVGPGVTTGLYAITIESTFYDQTGARQSVNSTVGITIEGTTDFDVIVQEVSGTAVSLSIANVGVDSASSISVKIPRQDSFSVVGSSEAFMGNLDPGDYSVASFQLVSKQKGSLAVEISYTDITGNRATIQKEVPLPSEGTMTSPRRQGARGGIEPPADHGGGKYILFGLGGIVAFILLFLIWKIKKRRER
ncbi:MAG: hypothetical protein V3R93_00840 [Candidatus Hydrothermarchaeaceae archaeon]